MIPNQTELLDPYGPIESLLFELHSSRVQQIVTLAGLSPSWILTEKEEYAEISRIRIYRQRVGESYRMLSEHQKQVFLINVIRELIKLDENYTNRVKEVLERIGWNVIEGKLVKIDILNPNDFLYIPKDAHSDLSKAADRISTDLSGTITSACGAIDTVCTKIYNLYPLGDIGKASFQEKIKKSLEALNSLEKVQDELKELGWNVREAKIFCENLKGSINQAAYVMQTLRSDMGDVHGNRPVINILAFQSIKWAMIILSLLQ